MTMNSSAKETALDFTRQPVIELSTSALAANLQQVRALAPTSKVVSMVKANAYGHGIEFALGALVGTDAFGVACIQEAREIRALGYQQPITLIEGVFNEQEWLEASDSGYDCVIHHAPQIEWALQHPDLFQQKNLKVWLKLNSGMNRLGFEPQQLLESAMRLRQAGFKLVLTMHFANADQPEHSLNQQQIDTFLTLKQQLSPIEASCCNSAAIYKLPNLHFDYVRPGIMLYGSSPFSDISAQTLGLQPVMRFKSRVMAIQQLNANEYVGYGSTYMTKRPTRLGIVAAGYGDGYPRALSAGAFVSINGQAVLILGRVSMDLMAVDLTDLPDTVQIGQSVELWGNHPEVDQLAQYNQTIGYELLCRLSKRPKRITIN